MSDETKETTTTTATLEDGGGEGGEGGLVINTTSPSRPRSYQWQSATRGGQRDWAWFLDQYYTPSRGIALRLGKRAHLLQRILSFHKTRNPKEYIDLRSSSKLFHRALPPPPLWTMLPCSNYVMLQSLMDHLEELQD